MDGYFVCDVSLSSQQWFNNMPQQPIAASMSMMSSSSFFFFKFKSWYLSFMLPLPLFDRHRRPTRAVHHHSQWPSHQMYDRKRRYIILFNMIFSFDVFIFNFCSTILDKLTISLSLPHSSIVWCMRVMPTSSPMSRCSLNRSQSTGRNHISVFRFPCRQPHTTHTHVVSFRYFSSTWHNTISIEAFLLDSPHNTLFFSPLLRQT